MAFEIRGKRVLITGANTGIGRATAVELARRGARVVITARNAERGEPALAEIRAASGGDVELLLLELASLASVRGAAQNYLARWPELHVLILNAGVANNLARAETADGFELMFGVNHLAHFELTRLLLDRIRASAPARIVVLSSAGYRLAAKGLDFDDLQSIRRPYHGLTIYGHSKLANLLFARELARRLAGSGVTVNAVHPGYVATELGNPRDDDAAARAAVEKARRENPALAHLPPPVSPEQGAATSIWLSVAPEVENVTGGYFVNCKPEPLLPAALDDDAAARLWKVSAELVDAVR